MPTEQTITIPGPVWGGRHLSASVIIKRKRVTATIAWDVGSIDVNGPASDMFRVRIAAAGMNQELLRWMSNNAPYVKPRPRLYGGERWGSIRSLPAHLADECAEQVARFYRAAAEDLPLTYEQMERMVEKSTVRG